MTTLVATALPIAATESDAGAGLITVVVIALLTAFAGYFIVCWLCPFTSCHHGRRTPRSRSCQRCQGTGLRLRVGRRVLNRLRATRYH